MKIKAKRIDNGEWAIGTFYLGGHNLEYAMINEVQGLLSPDKCDPNTLRYEINNKWYTMDHLEAIFMYLEMAPDALGRAVEGIITSKSILPTPTKNQQESLTDKG